MLTFPNCKINLGLHVVNKRADNFHNLETIFYPVHCKDALEIIPSNSLSFFSTGLSIGGPADANLCLQAYRILKNDFPDLPFVKIHLHKNIPMGAGLGGGSADGAFMLRMLNSTFNLQLSEHKLLQYALMLGSDCPFFIINHPCYAQGRGEILSQCQIDLSAYNIIFIHPGIHVSTKVAFSLLTPQKPAKNLQEIISQPIQTWKTELINDFETPVFSHYPAIKDIKDQLYNSGAIYASMTGSGSSVYGIFEKNNLPQFKFPPEYFVFRQSADNNKIQM